MLFIVSMPVLIRPLCQLKAAVFPHRCLVCAVLLHQGAKASIPLSTFAFAFADENAENARVNESLNIYWTYFSIQGVRKCNIYQSCLK
jgi:hypothetical protein